MKLRDLRVPLALFPMMMIGKIDPEFDCGFAPGIMDYLTLP